MAEKACMCFCVSKRDFDVESCIPCVNRGLPLSCLPNWIDRYLGIGHIFNEWTRHVSGKVVRFPSLYDEIHLRLGATRVHEPGKALPPTCFNDKHLGDYPSRSPSTVSHSYSLGSKVQHRNKKRAKQDNTARSVC